MTITLNGTDISYTLADGSSAWTDSSSSQVTNPTKIALLNKIKSIQENTDPNFDKCAEMDKMNEMGSFIEYLGADSREMDSQNRASFENDKNRLITLLAKNQNIYNKLGSRKITFYIFLGMLVFYTMGLIFIYLQTTMMSKDTQAVLLIGVTAFVLIMYAFVDIYIMATKRSYEEFETEPVTTTSTTCDATDKITTFIDKIDTMVAVNEGVSQMESEKNRQRQEVIDIILHDFNNVNYVNMRRYQITDYKINETRSNMHFVKYAFLLVSTIGLLAGFQLRTELNLESNYLPVSKGLLIGMSVMMVLLYVSILLLHKKQNMMRKKYNWNKLYWNVKATSEK